MKIGHQKNINSVIKFPQNEENRQVGEPEDRKFFTQTQEGSIMSRVSRCEATKELEKKMSH